MFAMCSRHTGAAGQGAPARQFPDPGALQPVHPQQGRLCGGQDHQWFSRGAVCVPILHNDAGQLYIDAALFGEDDLQMLFSFARAYFMVDMEIPSAYVQFLRSLMPRKPAPSCTTRWVWPSRARRCSIAISLPPQAFQRQVSHRSPASRAWSCWCSTCPVFRSCSSSSRTTTRRRKRRRVSRSRAKYLLVKQHDRVGRMADTLEYSEVAFPRVRFDDELIAEIEKFAPASWRSATATVTANRKSSSSTCISSGA